MQAEDAKEAEEEGKISAYDVVATNVESSLWICQKSCTYDEYIYGIEQNCKRL